MEVTHVMRHTHVHTHTHSGMQPHTQASHSHEMRTHLTSLALFIVLVMLQRKPTLASFRLMNLKEVQHVHVHAKNTQLLTLQG